MNYPDLIDCDNDRWTWNRVGRYYECPESGYTGDRAGVAQRFGPLTEDYNTITGPKPFILKIPEVPASVTKLVSIEDEEVYVRDGNLYWTNEDYGGLFTVTELMESHPSGLTEVVETDYDRAVSYFRNNPGYDILDVPAEHITAIIDHATKED